MALNAGVAHTGPFADVNFKEVEDTVKVNALHVIYTAKVLVGSLLSRYEKTGCKSAMIVVSSGLGAIPIPGFLTYSATKSFASFLAEGLNIELKGKVDVLSYQAGEVDTNMMKYARRNSRMIST